MTKYALKYFITLLFTAAISISPANAMICANGGQQYTCAGTPPICPQGQSACTSTPYSISGSASVSPTPVSNQNGFDRITVNSGGIYFYGWSCTGSSCSEISASGNLTVAGDSVSGSVSASMITSVTGNGGKLDFYNGSTLAGSITVSGSTFTGSASASNGLLSVYASGRILTFTGMNCSGNNCSVSSAGTINIAGTSYSCPLGSQYPCGNTGSGYFCSNISCIDDTVGGQFPSGAQVCAKDLNGDGTLEQNEIQQCTLVNGGMFCPIDAVDCSKTYQCSSGTYNPSTKRCESPASGYSCPTGYTLSGSVCRAAPQCPNGGAFNTVTKRCEQSATVTYICSLGGQYSPAQDICIGPPVSVSPSQSASYWFYNGAYRLYCSGSGMYLTANSGGYNRSWTITGATCSGDANGGAESACITYLVGSGNQLLVYAVPKTPWSCDEFGCTGGCGGTPMYLGALTFSPAIVSGSTRSLSCPLDDASGLSFHDQCVWATWTSISISAATYPPSKQAYSCPANWSLSGSICYQPATCPVGGSLNTTDNMCQIAGTAQCSNGQTYDSANNVCYTSATGIYACPYGSQYTCLPNPSTGNLQCSDRSCFTIASQQTQQNNANTTSYQNDGKVDPSTGKCLGQIYIFNGKPSQCRPPGISTLYFNCCDTNPGSLWFIQSRCGTQEAMTVQQIAKKQCHYIGDYCQEDWWLVGCVQSASVYCCFNSQLGRIIQEQGRPQLQTFQRGFGSAENPDCRGFTPEEFQHLDFSKIDLSEYVNGIVTTSQQSVANTMKKGITNYYNNVHINK